MSRELVDFGNVKGSKAGHFVIFPGHLERKRHVGSGIGWGKRPSWEPSVQGNPGMTHHLVKHNTSLAK